MSTMKFIISLFGLRVAKITGVGLILAVVVIGQQGAAAELQADEQETLGSIIIAHGQVYDRNWKRLELDPEGLIRLQYSTIQSLKTRVGLGSKSDSQRVDNILRAAIASTATREDLILAGAVKVGILASSLNDKEAREVLRANSLVTSRVLLSLKKTEVNIDLGNVESLRRFSPAVAGAVAASNISLKAFFPDAHSLTSGTNYANQCKAVGVPVPPSFNSNGSTGWVREGVLNFSILNPGNYTEIYSYAPTNGRGLCLAAPIRAVAQQPTYDALGIICQGLSSGWNKNVSNSRACFWDNASNNMSPNRSYALDNSTYFLSPPNLPQNNQCSDCHAGENAFIVHQGSVIQSAKDKFNRTYARNFVSQNNWYTPLLDLSWPQNVEPPNTYNSGMGPATGICKSCHTPNFAGRIPDVTGGVSSNPARDKLLLYCWAIASGEITSGSGPHAASVGLRGTPGPMYPFARGGSLTPLRNACNAVVPVFMKFPGGGTDNDWINW